MSIFLVACPARSFRLVWAVSLDHSRWAQDSIPVARILRVAFAAGTISSSSVPGRPEPLHSAGAPLCVLRARLPRMPSLFCLPLRSLPSSLCFGRRCLCPYCTASASALSVAGAVAPAPLLHGLCLRPPLLQASLPCSPRCAAPWSLPLCRRASLLLPFCYAALAFRPLPRGASASACAAPLPKGLLVLAKSGQFGSLRVVLGGGFGQNCLLWVSFTEKKPQPKKPRSCPAFTNDEEIPGQSLEIPKSDD